MRFDILTLFPGMFDGYFGESMIKRAVKNRRLDIRVHDLRRWSVGKHRITDDRAYGGGAGMVMMVEPFDKAVRQLTRGSKKKTRVVLLSAKGRTFTQKEAVRLAKYDRLVLLCGRYKGVDERVARHVADEELSIGDYVLTGGELPAMVVLDAVARNVPGVIGRAGEFLRRETHAVAGESEHPLYTRPEIYVPKKGVAWCVPKTLLSGDHKKIAEWQARQRRKIMN